MNAFRVGGDDWAGMASLGATQGASAGRVMEPFEQAVIVVISWMRLGIEVLGALVIVVGVIAAVVQAVRVRRDAAGTDWQGFRHLRLVLSQYLAMALEFQLAADILGTAIAPSWTEIGKLAAVATI